MMNMRFPKLRQVFPSQEVFNSYCTALQVGLIDDEIFAQMMIRYGDSTLRYTSHEVSAMKVIQIIATHYPVYLQRKEALAELRQLELEEFRESDMQIGNTAQNPNQEPVDEIIPYVSQQQTVLIKRGNLDAILLKYNTSLYGHVRPILNELAYLFKGIHAESEDVFIYDN